jgi:hypothetical protein
MSGVKESAERRVRGVEEAWKGRVEACKSGVKEYADRHGRGV